MKTFSELKIGDDVYFYHYETQIIKFGKIVNIHYDDNYITFIYETILESPRYLSAFNIGKNAASKLMCARFAIIAVILIKLLHVSMIF